MVNSETYVPKWTEFAVTIAIVALGFTIFGYAVKHFPVFPKEELEEEKPVRPAIHVEKKRHPVFSGNVVMGMWALVLIGAVTYAFTRNYENNHSTEITNGDAVARAIDPLQQELILPEDITFPLGEGSPGPVTFSHESHVLMQETPNCAACHAQGGFSILQTEPSQKQPLLMEPMYEGESCGKCHNGEDAFSSEDCQSCHIEP
jgi:c(7)-type cytochrome triheme protein